MAVVSQGTARLAIQRNKKLKYVIPRPYSKLWVDMYAMPRKAKNVDEAYEFIKFILKPARQVRDVELHRLPDKPAGHRRSKLPASVPLKSLIFIPPKDFARLEAYKVRPALQQYVPGLYDEIKAAAGG